jgi:hypothetical protein
MDDLYDKDFVLWAMGQAELLRLRAEGKRANDGEVDWSNIAEEIDTLGRSDRRELRNRVRTILVHLMKLQASPATEPRAGWHETIIEQRTQMQALLEDSPSLRADVQKIITAELSPARSIAAVSFTDHGEQPRVDPAGLTYSEEQVMGPWLP